MFLTVNKDVLTMLMTSLAHDATALGSIKVEVLYSLQDCLTRQEDLTSLGQWLANCRVLGNIESGVFFKPTFGFVCVVFPAGDSNLCHFFLLMCLKLLKKH